MRKPLFEVGEQVIRQAGERNYPEANGEYIVIDVITVKQYEKMIPGVEGLGNYYYKLEGLHIAIEDLHGKKTGIFTNYTSEKFLRKKHKPSELSFDSLMTTLKSSIKKEDLIK